MTVRLPGPPPATGLRSIGIRDDEYRIISTDELWWRVHRTTGDHVLAWNAFREHGPHLRFDPHPPPARHHPGIGIWYGASNPTPALAAAFQNTRTIDRFRGQPYLTALKFTRPIKLLDLATDSGGAWPTRAGGTFALSTGPHSITQRWARRITEAFPGLDGLRYNSRFAGQPCLALFTPAASAMPTRPALSLPLSHPGLALRITGAAQKLGYLVV
ncbi:RES family NAD+ phosphorylase [Mycolicibacterium sp.]|uniref:RES family NAD+ phosphorylase n=1 Tax=Mycolicibacterium sp. TaxID=2320850 RepID=UPI0037CB10DF